MVSEVFDARSHNPYSHITPIRTARMFFGRREAAEYVCNAVIDRQSVAIIGPRRIGKSSLLACIGLPEIQQRVRCDLSRSLLVYLDLEEHLQRTPEDFFTFVSEQLLRQSRGKLQPDMYHGGGADRFSQLLGEMQAQGVHPVLVLDEFDSVVRNQQFNPDFFSFLRAQANAGKVSYITASFATLDQICHSEIVGSPFFNIFSHYHLGPLTEDDALELITLPSKAAGCVFTETEVQFVVEQAGRHPFFIQRTCYFLFKHKSQSPTLDVKKIISQVYDELLPHFSYIWNHCDTEQLEQLKREVAQGSVQRKIPELSESALFRMFVRDKAKLAYRELDFNALHSALSKLDNLTFLGESQLSNLNIVAGENQGGTLTVVERGMRVRKLLQDALAQLRPTTPPGVVTPEWQMYSLLARSYFKKERRSNQQLAGYLSMSERDFYRKRNDAVNALLNVILKMEQEHIDGMEGGGFKS
ncbi:MAG TPA: AAA-like domain-containing protein [Ktedonobacteraceae bacterium]|nr:AAA-like domain-containing protein [Ktedonobacteraceae bacterium]